jgi:hypothetical protein
MNKKPWSAAMMVPLAVAATVSTASTAAVAVEPGARNVASARAACSDLRSQVALTARVNANDIIVLTLSVTTNRPRPQWDVRIARVNPNTGVNRPIFESREFAVPSRFNQERSFEVVARTPNQLGRDRFVARAVHVASGEVCRVQITV